MIPCAPLSSLRRARVAGASASALPPVALLQTAHDVTDFPCHSGLFENAAAEPVKAVAYMRTSSATNVGADKDSEQRQRAAIDARSYQRVRN
jgi:hypothetical protein